MIWGMMVIIIAGGCRNKQEPGRVYMPDMAYSRAYETYASTSNLDSMGIHYDKRPVPGTIKRGELFPFQIAMDKAGDSTNYNLSKQVQNPIPSLTPPQMVEAERLYLVNCAICHGGSLDGNGPLYNNGAGPYAAAPRNLISDPIVLNMPDGQMFYSITFGKGAMGPYGPQLSTSQRWMIIDYIRSRQKGGTTTNGADSTAMAAGTSTTRSTASATADSASIR